VKFLGAFDGRLVYFDKLNDVNKLWVSNGTPEGTIQISPGDQTDISLIIGENNTWFFTEKRGSKYYISKLTEGSDTLTRIHVSGIVYQDIFYWNGKFSWIQSSIGSNYDKVQLYDVENQILTTLVSSTFGHIQGIGASDAMLYYIQSTDQGKMLGKSDGTVANTSLFTTLLPAGNDNDHLTRFFSNGQKVYFFYNNSTDPFYLWTTDGTSQGTIQLGEFQNPLFNWPEDPAIFLHDKLLFILRESGAPSGTTFELNASDGTPTGTLTLDTHPDDYMQPDHLTLFNDKIYFTAQIFGSDLRVTDGTRAGTKVILETYGHENGSVGFIGDLGIYNNSMVVQAYEETHGSELYKTNGTVAGTTLMADVIRGSAESVPGNFMQVGSRLFFTAFYSNHNRMWIYDPDFVVSCDSFIIGDPIITSVTDSTTGSIHLAPIGGQQPYIYKLDNMNPTTSSQFNNLALGNHNVVITDNLGCVINFPFLIEESTGIVEPEYLKAFTIAPNPTTANKGIELQLNLNPVHLDPISIFIHNFNGQTILNTNINITSSQLSVPIATKNFPPGQYILSVIQDGKILGSHKLIVE
jgi:ELWxxDGT repeat protein